MTEKRGRGKPVKPAGRRKVGAKAENASTLRARALVKRLKAAKGLRFVVVLRGGDEAQAMESLLKSGYGPDKNAVVRRALIHAARRAEKSKA